MASDFWPAELGRGLGVENVRPPRAQRAREADSPKVYDESSKIGLLSNTSTQIHVAPLYCEALGGGVQSARAKSNRGL